MRASTYLSGERDVATTLPWDIQWRAPLDGGMHACGGARGLHNHYGKVPGHREPPQRHSATLIGDLRSIERVHLNYNSLF